MDQIDIRQHANSSRTGVTVFTWGSQDAHIKQQYLTSVASHLNSVFLQNHNPGHAAVQLTISDTPENLEMVSTILEGTGITYKVKTYHTPLINFPLNTTNMTQGSFDNHMANAESVIEVYFSFWPGDKNQGVFKNYQQDLAGERSGVPVNYNRDRLEELNPEIELEQRSSRRRTPKSFFRETESEITLGFTSIFHEVQGKPELNELVQSYQQYQIIATQLNFIDETQKKIKAVFEHTFKDGIKNGQKEAISSSLRNALKKIIGLHVSGEINQLLSLDSVSKVEFEKIFEVFQTCRNNVKNKNDWLSIKFMSALYHYAEATPMSDQQKQRFAEIYEVKKLYFAALRVKKNNKDNVNIKKLNSFIVKANLPEYSRKIMTDEQFLEFFASVKAKVCHFDSNSMINQDIRIKIEDIIDSRTQTNLAQKKLFLETILAVELLLSDEARINNPEERNKIKESFELHSKVIMQLYDEDLFNTKLDDFKQVFKYLQECHQMLWHAKEIDKKMISTTLNQLLDFTILYFDTTQRKANTLDPDMINQLSGQSYFLGKQPDHTLTLPIKTFIKDGLDPVAMLNQMANIAHETQRFDLISYNCSNTTMEILSAGAGEKSWIFNQGELGTVFTPHIVYMRTREYLNELNDPYYEKPTPYFFAYKNLLDNYGSRAVAIAAKHEEISKQSFFGKIKSGIEMIYTGGVAIALETAGSIVFNEQKKLHDDATKCLKRHEDYEDMDGEEKIRARKRIRYNDK